ncbi:ribosomal-processing cysteine protease Prp [Peptoniphilus sp. KCTC 25270]|uniref:ribosomal-processing cysteine protease Prp n=1 Tax=Peptoniphilus sp. KCTC 25270 TaxID=2897414 RepID=UPI001E3C0E80|nr:ribosomal-processing cysteine protease Prp [Peptoniphilus sp. KCTC 25270]MCD1146918.1 ribosomal-processing cysteine protease Prp [Peptoniphilus sp. KCTC 25270]
MTKVTIYKRKDLYLGFLAREHADTVDDFGSVVCGSISALTLTSILSLNQIAHIDEKECIIEQEDGHLLLRLEENVADSKEAQVILESLEVGLMAIQENYSKYIEIKIQEV